MKTKKQHSDDRMTVRNAFLRKLFYKQNEDGKEYKRYAAITPDGIVLIYSQGGANPHTRFDYTNRGCLWMRTFNFVMSDRAMLLRARAFAEDREFASR